MKVLSTKKTFKVLNKKLDNRKRFAYLRYGDGRIMMMDGWKGEQSDHFYSPKLREELIDSIQIEDEDYMISVGCGYKMEKGMKGSVFGRFTNDDKLQEIVSNYANQDRFYNFIALHYYSLFKPELLIEFFKKIRERRVVIAGGEHLRKTAGYFKAEFVSAPKTDAYKEIEAIYKNIFEKKPEVVILGLGMCSAVLQKWIFQEGREVITLDFGSLLDAMLGIQSRGWIVNSPERIRKFIKLLNNGKS